MNKVYSENRPWGRFEKFHENKPCTVKLIYINANSRLSLQYHNKRSEFWKVVKGTAIVELDGKSLSSQRVRPSLFQGGQSIASARSTVIV